MSTAAQGARTRAAAARVVRAVRFDGASLRTRLPATLESFADPRDRALCEAMCFEATRWALRYERVLERLLQRPLPPQARDVHALLLVGLAQIDAMGIADHAAISSSAEAARTLRQPRHVGLVNAVLRRFLRERGAIEAALGADPAWRDGHPAWLRDTFRRDWGDDAQGVLDQGNREAPMWLRVNLRRSTREAVQQRLAQHGIETRDSPLAPQALRLQQRVAPARLPGWDEGLISIQDLAAQLSVQALDAGAGHRVLDACAAPGGKLAHLAELSSGLEGLLGLDVDPARLSRVGEALARLGLDASLLAADAGRPDTWWDGRGFHRILLDAPCSATGILRRQPDIRLHRGAADVRALAAQQARLLDALWPLLLPGGRLVYATCSVLRDENERQIDAFLARTPDAMVHGLPDHFGRVAGAGRQRLPGEDDGDGFFHAALERRAR